MNCLEAERLEPLYATGDLDPKTMAELDLHVGQCRDCALRWKESEQVDTLLRDAVMADPVDAGRVIERVRRQMKPPERTPSAWRHKLTFAVCALSVSLAVGSIFLIRALLAPTLYDYAAHDHIAEVVNGAPRPWTTGSAQIEHMVQEHLALSGLVQTLTPDGYYIERAMVCPLHDQRYSHLIYSNGTQKVSFFIGRQDNRELPGRTVDHANGFPLHLGHADNLKVAGFQTGQFNVLVVGDLSAEETIRLITRAASVI